MEEQTYVPGQQRASLQDFYAQDMNEDKIKNIISQISPSNQVEEIEMRIKGYKKNFETGDWEKIIDSKISDELVGRYTSWLSSFMNLNTTLGNLSAPQITRLMKNAVEFVVDDVDAHAREYGVEEDYTERTRICDILLNSTFLVLNRSLNGAEARRFWSSLSLAESSSMNPMQQQKSEWWKFWKK
ncbi:MAG: hypothetical protein ACOC5T_08260 [Elusimicrobiota bacterium]